MRGGIDGGIVQRPLELTRDDVGACDAVAVAQRCLIKKSCQNKLPAFHRCSVGAQMRPMSVYVEGGRADHRIQKRTDEGENGQFSRHFAHFFLF